MTEKNEPMSTSYRPLSAIWADFEKVPGIAETLEERQAIMEPFVRDRILGYIHGYRENPWGSIDYVLKNIAAELSRCKELYTNLELRRLIGQEIAYAVEEWRKPTEEAFRVGSREEFQRRYRDEMHSPDLVRAGLAELTRTVQGWRGYPAVTFGISKLDNAFGGLYPGEICVLAGTPGSMKTSLALHAVEDFIERTDQFACYYSLDMPCEMIVERLLIRECGIPERDLRLQLADGMPQALKAKKDVYERYGNRLAIKGHSPAGNLSVQGMLHDVAARMPGFVVVDYLTRLKAEGQSDIEFVEPAMNQIHRFAAAYQVPFLILSQMSRASRSDQASGRVGGHSRGGGIVEELAYTEIELQKHFMPEGETLEGESDPIIASVTKARHGESGRSYFIEKNGAQMRFTGRAVRVNQTKKQKAAYEAVHNYMERLNG